MAEPALALGITDALSFEGYRVVHAPTGRQAVELARAACPPSLTPRVLPRRVAVLLFKSG